MGYDHEKKRPNIKEEKIVADMESLLRDCVHRYRGEILSADLEATRAAFITQIVDRVHSLNEPDNGKSNDDEPVPDPTIKIVSIDVPHLQVHQAVQKKAETGILDKFVEAVAGDIATDGSVVDFATENFVAKTHVTMMFWTESTQDLIRRAYGHLVGSEVDLMATALLWDDNVAALQVNVPTTTKNGVAIPECKNKFSHVTVWIADGAEARMSNQLPENVSKGTAQSVLFAEPIPLSGVISFWDFKNNPLPNEG